MAQIKTISGRIGGKWRISGWVLEHLKRFDWSLYVEPFCGSAAIYFQLLNEGFPDAIRARGCKPRFVLNDRDSRIINLFRACRDYPELLAYSAWFTPYSREEYNASKQINELDEFMEICNKIITGEWLSFSHQPTKSWGFQQNETDTKDMNKTFVGIPNRLLEASEHLGEKFNEIKEGLLLIPDESVRKTAIAAFENLVSEANKSLESDIRLEFARKFLVRNRQSMAKLEKGWGIGTKEIDTDGGEPYDEYRQWNSVSERIIEASPLFNSIGELKKVYLENDDFEKVCRRWDVPHSLHYLDPPYIDVEHYYKGITFGKDDHDRLCQMAHELKGQVVISYYPHPEITSMYHEDDWEYHYKEVTASSKGVTKTAVSQTRPKRTELLLVRKNRSDKVNYTGQMTLF
jgi:site-specific DNA-adenine methylase